MICDMNVNDQSVIIAEKLLNGQKAKWLTVKQSQWLQNVWSKSNVQFRPSNSGKHVADFYANNGTKYHAYKSPLNHCIQLQKQTREEIEFILYGKEEKKC